MTRGSYFLSIGMYFIVIFFLLLTQIHRRFWFYISSHENTVLVKKKKKAQLYNLWPASPVPHYNQVCRAMPALLWVFSSNGSWSCRHSSSSRLQLDPCVVEKQAWVCGESACLQWEGAVVEQRSRSEQPTPTAHHTCHTPLCPSLTSTKLSWLFLH